MSEDREQRIADSGQRIFCNLGLNCPDLFIVDHPGQTVRKSLTGSVAIEFLPALFE